MVFGPWGTIWDPLSAAAPWAICQYNWSRTLAPSKFDYFNPKALFSLFSQIPGVNKTHETITVSALIPQNPEAQTNSQ